MTGALYGRAVGVGMLELYELWTGSPLPEDEYWWWLDPGLIATLGAASLLGGVTRLTLAITVILVSVEPKVVTPWSVCQRSVGYCWNAFR